MKEYQKALDVQRNSSLAHYRVAELFFLQNNYQSAANEFREVLNGDLEPKWTEVWAHINLGKIFDITDQRERAVNEYRQALRTKDNTQGALEQAGKYINEKYRAAADLRTNGEQLARRFGTQMENETRYQRPVGAPQIVINP